MKTLKFFTAAVLVLLGSAALAQEKSVSFAVSGNCDVYKQKIEHAAKAAGAAHWNAEKQLVSVAFDSTKVSIEAIRKKIADAGYDTERFAAGDKAYTSLPGCCQYERSRPEVKKTRP